MQIKLKNKDLEKASEFLATLTMKGKKSLCRSKMQEILGKKQKELADDRKTIIESYADKDKDGKPVLNEDGTYKLTSDANLSAGRELAKLLDEDAVIDYGEYTSKLTELEKFLEDFDEEVPGHVAQGFYALVTAFENKEDL